MARRAMSICACTSAPYRDFSARPAAGSHDAPSSSLYRIAQLSPNWGPLGFVPQSTHRPGSRDGNAIDGRYMVAAIAGTLTAAEVRTVLLYLCSFIFFTGFGSAQFGRYGPRIASAGSHIARSCRQAFRPADDARSDFPRILRLIRSRCVPCHPARPACCMQAIIVDDKRPAGANAERRLCMYRLRGSRQYLL